MTDRKEVFVLVLLIMAIGGGGIWFFSEKQSEQPEAAANRLETFSFDQSENKNEPLPWEVDITRIVLEGDKESQSELEPLLSDKMIVDDQIRIINDQDSK